MIKWITTFLATCILGSGSVFAAAIEPSVIILYGDSITVGYNLETNFTENFGLGRTVSQLNGSQPLIATNDLLNNTLPSRSSIVVNWGVGGSTSSNGVQRISSSLRTTKSQHSGRNYYVLIMYGTNDIPSGLTSATSAFNIRQIINAVRAEGDNFIPIVATVTPRDDHAVEPLNSAIAPMVQSDGTVLVNPYQAFVDSPGGFGSLLGEETSSVTGKRIKLHPNVSGYNLIAQTWFDQALAGLIEPDSSVFPTAGALFLLLNDDD